MTIYLDFDGTIVEHKYPLIGHCNAGWVQVVHKLHKAGHEILINTTRVELDAKSFAEAIEYIRKSLSDQHVQSSIFTLRNTDYKYDPAKWDWNLHLDTKRIYIDDMCEGIPLKKGIYSERYMVDWNALNREFEERNLY